MPWDIAIFGKSGNSRNEEREEQNPKNVMKDTILGWPIVRWNYPGVSEENE